MIAIIDYDAGNIRSVQKACEALGDEEVAVTGDGEEILAADRVILPGVGAFGSAMERLKARGLDEARPIVADLAQNFQTATGHECADHAGIVQPVLRPSRTTERAALCVDGLSGPGRGDIPPKRRYFDYRRGAGRRNQGTRNSPTAYKPRWTN